MSIEIENLSLKIRNSIILHGISASIPSDSITSVLGANGSGKSSLLKCLAGLISYKGKIKNSNYSLNKISYVPQRPAVPVGMTLAEFVLLGRSKFTNWYSAETELDREKCQEAISSLSLSKLASRLVETLSGGELQRAVLARAVAQESSVLLLDEPTSALDIVNQIEVMSYLISLQKRHKLIIVMALHDLNLALNFSDRTLLLKDGHMIGFGLTKTIMNAKRLSEAYESPIEIISKEDENPAIFVKYNLSQRY